MGSGLRDYAGMGKNRFQIKKAIENPDFIKEAKFNRLAVIKSLDDELSLRIIYEESDTITVVTIMVVKRDRYEV